MFILGLIVGIILFIVVYATMPFVALKLSIIQSRLLIKRGQRLANEAGDLAQRVAIMYSELDKIKIVSDGTGVD